MIRASYGTLEKAPNTFSSIGVNIATHPFFLAMIDRLVASIVVGNASICRPFVSYNASNPGVCAGTDEVVQGLTPVTVNYLEYHIPTTLGCSCYNSFVASVPSSLTSCFSTNVSLVYFYCSRELIDFGHSGSDAMAEVPSSLVGNSQSAVYLVCRDTFLGLSHQQHGHKPLAEGQLGILKNSTSESSEAIPATITIISESLRIIAISLLIATWASYTVGPSQFRQNLSAFFLFMELLHYFHH